MILTLLVSAAISLQAIPSNDGKNRSSVFVEFADNLGTVEIELSNAATGEYRQGEVSSASGWAAVPFSGDEGFYIIRFTLPSGAQYYGEFEIAQ